MSRVVEARAYKSRINHGEDGFAASRAGAHGKAKTVPGWLAKDRERWRARGEPPASRMLRISINLTWQGKQRETKRNKETASERDGGRDWAKASRLFG